MNAYVFPGQGSQFPGMGKDLYDESDKAKNLFKIANEVLGFDISHIMFNGSAEDLKQTNITQPSVFIHSCIAMLSANVPKPNMVAGHSLGEFSALVACEVLKYQDALGLVAIRAKAMQKACEKQDSTMAAVLNLEDKRVEEICKQTKGIVVAANYNCPGQIVISGETQAVKNACEALLKAGAKRALLLPVGGAFHSPLMQPAKEELASAINDCNFNDAVCPIYQNINAKAITNAKEIKQNLIDQLTGPVKWNQLIQAMIDDGATQFTEFGPGKVLTGLIKKISQKQSLPE